MGVRNGIPTGYSKHGATLAAGTSTATIQAALDAANAAGGSRYVLLGAGTFAMSGRLTIPTGVLLTGSGQTSTILTISGDLAIYFSGSGSPGSQISITAGFTKGSTNITSTSDMSLTVGDFVLISQDDDADVYKPDGGTQHNTFTCRVEAGSSGTSINLWPAIPYAVGANPKAAKIASSAMVQNAGVSNLKILASDSGVTYNILMAAAYGCWVENVQLGDIYSYGVYVKQSLGCEIKHLDIYNTYAGADGYGVDLDNQDKGNCAIAVYNCIFSGLFHSIITSGQQACAFGHNYSVNEHRGGSVYQTPGLNVSHNACGNQSIWEANIANSVWQDQIHGNAINETFLRCWFHGNDEYNSGAYNLSKGAMFELQTGAYYYNVVGCILGDTLNGPYWTAGTSFYKYDFTAAEWIAASAANFGGMYILGFDGSGTLEAKVGSTITRYTNFDYWHNATQNTGAFTFEDSLMFSSKPTWYGNLAWPPFDPSSPPTYSVRNLSKIPAGYRYWNSGNDPTSGTVPIRSAIYAGKTVNVTPT